MPPRPPLPQLALACLACILSLARILSTHMPSIPQSEAAIFLLAPVPNSLCARLGGGADDFSSDYNSCEPLTVPPLPLVRSLMMSVSPSLSRRAYKDFASFLTATLVASASALPLVLAHTGSIAQGACWMSLAGGGLVYGTILVFSGTFVRLPVSLPLDGSALPWIGCALRRLTTSAALSAWPVWLPCRLQQRTTTRPLAILLNGQPEPLTRPSTCAASRRSHKNGLLMTAEETARVVT